MNCTLCQVESDDIKPLDLRVNGSEDVWLCLQCRIILCNVARGIQERCMSAKLGSIKFRKDRGIKQ